MSEKTLYERHGGYDAISAIANDLLPPLTSGFATGSLLAASKRGWRKAGKAAPD